MTSYDGKDAVLAYRDQLLIHALKTKAETGRQFYRGPSPMSVARQRWPEIITGRTAKKCWQQLLDSDIIEEADGDYRMRVSTGEITQHGNN